MSRTSIAPYKTVFRMSIIVLVATLVVAVTQLWPYLSGNYPLPWQCHELDSFNVMSVDGLVLSQSDSVIGSDGVVVSGQVKDPGNSCYVAVVAMEPASNRREVVAFGFPTSTNDFSMPTQALSTGPQSTDVVIEIVVGNLYCATFLNAVETFGLMPDVCRLAGNHQVRLAPQ